MRVVVNAPPVGEQPTGPGVHLAEVMSSLLAQATDVRMSMRSVGLRNRGAAGKPLTWTSDPRVGTRHTALPQSLLGPLQARLRLPAERFLVGRYDVYHQLHTDTDPAVPGRKLVVTLHDTVALRWPQAEGKMYARAGHVLRRANRVLTVSEYSKGVICSTFGVPEDRVRVVGNGVDHDRFRPVPEDLRLSLLRGMRLPKGRWLLYVGGATPRKNVPALLRALVELRRQPEHAAVGLVLAGPVCGAGAELARSVADELPATAITFLPYVSAAAMPALYSAAAALVFPSLYEGFGLPVLEAMACGAPVVTSDVTALPEVAGGHAVLVNPTDPIAIARAVAVTLERDKAEAAACGDAARAWAQRFTWAATAARVLEVYREVAAGNGRRRGD